MKTKQKYYVFLIVVLIVFPILNSVSVVAQGADYIGINENDSYMWNLSYDEDVDDDLGDDMGINTTLFDIDDDVKAFKQVITWVGNEDEYGSDKGVKYKRNLYDSKTRGNAFGQGYNWKMEDEGGEFVILKYESGDDSVLDYYQMCAMWGAFFTATNVNWEKVVEELDDDLSGDGYAHYNEYDNSIRIHIYEHDYDYQTGEYEIEEVDIWTEYTNDGILEYYRIDYDVETIVTLELVNRFWVQYRVLIVIGIIALGAVIVLIIYFTAIRTPKVKEKVPPSAPVPAAKPEEKPPEAVKIEEKKPEGGLFCPYCGNMNTAGAKFCEFCGKTMEE